MGQTSGSGVTGGPGLGLDWASKAAPCFLPPTFFHRQQPFFGLVGPGTSVVKGSHRVLAGVRDPTFSILSNPPARSNRSCRPMEVPQCYLGL